MQGTQGTLGVPWPPGYPQGGLQGTPEGGLAQGTLRAPCPKCGSGPRVPSGRVVGYPRERSGPGYPKTAFDPNAFGSQGTLGAFSLPKNWVGPRVFGHRPMPNSPFLLPSFSCSRKGGFSTSRPHLFVRLLTLLAESGALQNERVLLKLQDLLQGGHLERLVAFLIGAWGSLMKYFSESSSPERRSAAGSCGERV